jgi:hypothetical protein
METQNIDGSDLVTTIVRPRVQETDTSIPRVEVSPFEPCYDENNIHKRGLHINDVERIFDSNGVIDSRGDLIRTFPIRK